MTLGEFYTANELSKSIAGVCMADSSTFTFTAVKSSPYSYRLVLLRPLVEKFQCNLEYIAMCSHTYNLSFLSL